MILLQNLRLLALFFLRPVISIAHILYKTTTTIATTATATTTTTIAAADDDGEGDGDDGDDDDDVGNTNIGNHN